jgi:serine/threonine-protein kinase
MEYLEGHDLATLLVHREPMPMSQAVNYGLQACHALAHAHVRGIVHRDLKPENLFAARDPTGDVVIKLLDFGLSKDESEEDGDGDRRRQLTTDQQVMGTPHYMSPEQWMSSTGVGPASDQWALAAIIFEMLTGRPPFEGATLAHVCAATMHDPTPSLRDRMPNLPRGLDAVLAKALEKNPLHRYENIGAFGVALAAFAKPGAAAKAEVTLDMLGGTSARPRRSPPRSAGPRTGFARTGAARTAAVGADDSQTEVLAMPDAPTRSDIAPTMKNPPKFVRPPHAAPPAPIDEDSQRLVAPRLDAKRIRSTTSTSWQRMEQQRDSRKIAVIAAAVGIGFLFLGAGAIYFVGERGTVVDSQAQPSDTESAEPASLRSNTAEKPVPGAPSDPDPAPPATSWPSSESAAPSASAPPAPSSAPRSTKGAPLPNPSPAEDPFTPPAPSVHPEPANSPTPLPPAVPTPRPPKPKTSIFDER